MSEVGQSVRRPRCVSRSSQTPARRSSYACSRDPGGNEDNRTRKPSAERPPVFSVRALEPACWFSSARCEPQESQSRLPAWHGPSMTSAHRNERREHIRSYRATLDHSRVSGSGDERYGCRPGGLLRTRGDRPALGTRARSTMASPPRWGTRRTSRQNCTGGSPVKG